MTGAEIWNNLCARWECLKEACNGSYSRQYRVFRLKEALGVTRHQVPEPKAKR